MTSPCVTVLIVEDEEDHAELLQRAFEGVYHVVLAPSLERAREIIGRDSFDIVITDMRLPDGLGTTLLDEAVETPVVIMTSHGDERAAVDAIKRGAYDYVVKSAVAFEEMPRVTERVLRERRRAAEHEEMQTALAQRDRLASIGTAAAMLAHEIGNPLNSMSLSAQLIDRRLDKLDADVSEIRELNTTIKREIGRLVNLLAEFRSLARERDLPLEPVPVKDLFSAAVDAKRPMLDASEVEISVALDGNYTVLANREKIQQVLVNLLKNAREAMPDGGRVELSAVGADGDVVLTITDNGPGIPDDVDVFTPFATTKASGSGLGLAVVSQILASHGGRVWHEPAEDGGTRFCLQLIDATV